MLENEIRAYSLRNSIEYGTTTAGNILPKLFMHGLKKEDIKTIMPLITKIVNEINKLSSDKKASEFEKYKQYIREQDKGREDELPELEDVPKTGVIMRISPSAFLLKYGLCEKQKLMLKERFSLSLLFLEDRKSVV